MQGIYWQPVIDSHGRDGVPLAGGPLRFSRVLKRDRRGRAEILPASQLPDTVAEALTAPRPSPSSGPSPHIMGILNVTPDSFSDGGEFLDPAIAKARGAAMVGEGAAILDIGGESTRPGADFVAEAAEIARTEPIITALADAPVPLSIDTRKAAVADRALAAGATIFNDVTALSFDDASAGIAARHQAWVVLMHASGDPKTMQSKTDYDDVVCDVYDYLSARIDHAIASGIPRGRIIVDPGIGFGKTLAQNLDLIRNLAVFHGLGCPVLVGASRKKFIGTITGTDIAAERMPGSLAIALAAAAQGAQIIRVHDVSETRAALDMWRALLG